MLSSATGLKKGEIQVKKTIFRPGMKFPNTL